MTDINEQTNNSKNSLVVVIVIIIIIILGVSITIFNKNKSVTLSNNFCSSYSGVCFNYPSNWTIKTTGSTSLQSKIAAGKTVTSPTRKNGIGYSPLTIDSTNKNACPNNSCKFLTLSIIKSSHLSNVDIVQGIFQGSQSNGTLIFDEYFLISSKNLNYYGLKVGQNVNASYIIAPIFFSSKKNQNTPQSMIAYSVQNASGSGFSDMNKAKAWFDDPEVKTIGQILQSAN